jgi:hypothetical protein
MYKVTRERIRQIENKATIRLHKKKIFKDFIFQQNSMMFLDKNDVEFLFRNKSNISYIPERSMIAKRIILLHKTEDYHELIGLFQKAAMLNGYRKSDVSDEESIICLLKRCKEPKILKKNNNQNHVSKTKLSIKDIITVIIDLEPALINNDREFCRIFDELALDSGYTTENLPSYWTICRAIYNYKSEKNINSDDTNKVPINYNIDLTKPIYSKFLFDKKPTIRDIIAAIVQYDTSCLENDRELIRLFDGIALNNGYDKQSLPKYWTIIRAVYDYKRQLKEVAVH